MDFSSANTALWSPIIDIGVIAVTVLFANMLRRKVGFIQRALAPTAVMAGFILLLLRSIGILQMDMEFLETVTYHALAVGFIAMALRIPANKDESWGRTGRRTGALIVSTYLVQAAAGLVISILLAYTLMPDFFKASGILLAMAYGQGPGQANNVGATYEALGMLGGRSFGLSLAASGYICACVVGVVFLNIYSRKGLLKRAGTVEEVSGSVTIDMFQDKDELPISESVDRLSVQMAFICLVYLVTYLVTDGITRLLGVISPGLASTVSTLLWGFNFIIGSAIATLCRSVLKGLRSARIVRRQYQNNYLLSRISGVAFDLMIVAGIASINISDLSGLWLPFILMSLAGGVITFFFLRYMCRLLYREYEYEAFFALYGMLTGTISSGVLLLRELDPYMDTPAANNLISGSSYGILFGAPVLLFVSLAARSDLMLYITLFLIIAYLAALVFFLIRPFRSRKR